MLNSLENYVWRYNSAVELVNLIFTYIEQNALRVFYFLHTQNIICIHITYSLFFISVDMSRF